MTNNQKLAVVAVKRILDSLAASDFVTNSGTLAMGELRQYGGDIAEDIAAVFDGREPTDAEAVDMLSAI